MNLNRVMLNLIFVFFLGCSSAVKNPEVALPKPAPVGSQNHILTQKEIIGLRIVDGGSALLYMSGERLNHKQRQLYRFDLAPKKETRITHHDGDVISAEEFGNGTKVIYASSTDELKEKVQMDFWAEKRAPMLPSSLEQTPTELYISSRDGSGIHRLTHSPGYDAEATVHKFGRFIYFVSSREGHRAIFRSSIFGEGAWRVTPEKIEAFSPKISPDGKKLVWLQMNEKVYDLKYGGTDFQKSETLFSFTARPSGLTWTSSGKILFSGRAQGASQHQIWEYDLENRCARLMLDQEGLEDSEPALSPDGKSLYFLERLDAQNAISAVDLKETGDCSKSVVF